MTQTSVYGRLRRALDTRNATIALAAAAELDYVGLSDALELVLLLLDTEPNRYSRAALRWHARYVRRGTVSMPKGVWRRSTRNGLTSNALAPDSLTDLGAGACFNDARVEVEVVGRGRN